jgi:methylthioribose-1-phosphate isomerase
VSDAFDPGKRLAFAIPWAFFRTSSMNVRGRPTRTIWVTGDVVEIIDQTALPHDFAVRPLRTLDDVARAISGMQVRGAPLIGVAAVYGVWLAMRAEPSDAGLRAACATLLATRPTAVNLRWALDTIAATLAPLPASARAAAARARADALADEDVAVNRAIGDHALALIRRLADARTTGGRFNVLTHCNAGWLATVDRGTALSGIYAAHDAGLPVHVWVDETRPRNQGAALTAWELGQHGVPHTLIVDNAGGHLMQRGQVDLVLVGTDRTTATGDVVNKIGTYLKALAALDCGVPFYVAAPSSSIDWTLADGREVMIEERAASEVVGLWGRSETGAPATVRFAPEGTPVANPGFDLTPARLVTGIITERGVAAATREGLAALFPSLSSAARSPA